ncbi:uncharacterized protein A4U43_C09F4640 [Asparagus officinalis]|uniref:Response regulatory domain-containing protein n=1 Tax=Asparagus officinalis TaxID=4686 RepID=A0A5P1E5B5_ASPOF|nr:uncharacterized protein A4U43_C09F4640 [Asparagus officinalis]
MNASSKSIKILLVEDVKINRMVMRMMVKSLGLEMEEAEDGQKAVDYFVGGKKADVVLMDRDMPIMNGHEATRQLRSMGVETPIIVLSADDSQSNRDVFLQAGADEFLQSKPPSRKELVDVLTKYGLY